MKPEMSYKNISVKKKQFYLLLFYNTKAGKYNFREIHYREIQFIYADFFMMFYYFYYFYDFYDFYFLCLIVLLVRVRLAKRNLLLGLVPNSDFVLSRTVVHHVIG